MEGSNPRRIARLVINLISHPSYIPFYLKHMPYYGKSPVDIELPWISYEAIQFLEKFLTSEMEVFDWGCGGSTFFFSKRVKHITAIENHRDWYELVVKKMVKQNICNVDLQLHEGDLSVASNFLSSSYFQAGPKKKYDVIMIDGYETPEDVLRPFCFDACEEYVKENGIILVDDSYRYKELRTKNKANDVKIFKSIGPGRYGVTSTDLYFY